MVSLSAAKSDPPTPRSRALARAGQQRERERVARRKERETRHRERRERRSEEFRLREQQGLSLPGTEEYSSLDEEEEEEEEVREQVLPDRWELAPPSSEPAPVAGVASPGRAQRRPPPGSRRQRRRGPRGASARGGARACGRGGWRCCGGRAGRARYVGGDLEEVEARLLLLEVRDCLSRGRKPVRRELDGLFPCSQGGANRASPLTGQGAEGGCVRPNPAAFVKGAAGGGERGSNSERELARRG
jgi:hypothetical protein